MSDYQLNPDEIKKLNGAVSESVNSLIRQEGEQIFRKDVASRIEEELGFKPAIFNALVNERYSEKISKRIEKDQEIVDLAELLKTASKNVTTSEPDELIEG